MTEETKFKKRLMDDLEERFPGSIITKLDPGDIQGIPDLLILYNDRWAILEVKKSKDAHRQPNQEYYVDLLNDMSYSSFVYPENEEVVLNELEQALCIRR